MQNFKELIEPLYFSLLREFLHNINIMQCQSEFINSLDVNNQRNVLSNQNSLSLTFFLLANYLNLF